MAVKIRLKRLGKIRAPYYRIVVADSRTKRDGRVDRGDRQVPPHRGALVHRGRLRARAVLARRRRPADRAGRRAPQDHRRLAEVQGPARPAEGTLRVAAPKAGQARAVFEAAGKEAGSAAGDVKEGATTLAAKKAAEVRTTPPRWIPAEGPAAEAAPC